MRILFVTHSPHIPEIKRGVERNTDQLCVRLRAMGHEVAVISALASIGWTGRWASLRLRIGASSRAVRDGINGYPTYRCWNVDTAFDDVVRRVRPDIVVVQSWIRTVARCRELGVPVAYYVHSANEPTDPGTDDIRDNTLWLTVSAFAARHNGEAAGLDFAIVPTIVDPAQYRVRRHDPRHVTMIGLHPRKGAERTLALAAACPDIPFVIHDNVTGHGADTTGLHAEAARLANVTVRAPTDSPELIYGQTRLLLAPSFWPETWGRVVSEAQVNGIPVLASDRGALLESVGPGGLCLPYEAPLEEWIAALRRIWDDPEIYATLSARALEHAARPSFAPERVTADFVALLQAHLARQGQDR